MIFIRNPFTSELKYLNFETAAVDETVIRNTIGSYLGYTDFTLFYNGRKLHDAEVVPDNSTIHVTFSLPGGKGGFGSMLRAIGAQIEKTTNREACRDLSGRRLRDINEEQRLKKWISKEAERKAEQIKRRQARIEKLKSKPTHKFFDFEYEKKISELPDRINDALNEGLREAKEPVKRPLEEPGTSESRIKKAWALDEFSSSSSDSDSETNVEKYGCPSPSKRPKIDSKDNSNTESSPDYSQHGQSFSSLYSKIDSEVHIPVCSGDGLFERKNADVQLEDTSSSCNSAKSNIQCTKIEVVSNNVENEIPTNELYNVEENNIVCATNGESQSTKDVNESKTKSDTVMKEPEIQDNCPINLLEYQSSSELEALGLDKLKMELMSHGLKCGGALSDRAQRLWKIRGLQPNEYPTNLLAKKK